MKSQTPDMQAVLDRLEKLETQNRRLKRAGALALAAVGSVVLMGQGAPKSHTVEAEQFVVKDSSGKIRASLGMVGEYPSLDLFDGTGKVRAGIGLLGGGDPAISLSDPAKKAQVFLAVTESGPGLLLTDDKGFETSIGSTDLVTARTGETHQTSAASLVMFDKERNIIWRAPSAVSQNAAEPSKRPRVFIEAWGVPNTATSSVNQINKGPVRVTEPTQEMATFALRCPQAIVTIERQKADYVLRLDESLIAPLYPQGHATYRSLVLDAEGSQIGTGAELSSLDDSLEGACRTILNSATPSQ